MSNTNVIYALSLDGKSHRYIGMTKNGHQARLQSHVRGARAGSQLPVHRWMRKHGVDNVQLVVLERMSSSNELPDAEIRWIKHLRIEGYELLNLTEGGQHGPRYWSTLKIGLIDDGSELDSKSLSAYHNRVHARITGGQDVNLNQYANTSSTGRKRRRCLTCALDTEVLQQINDARNPSKSSPLIPFPLISRWLEDETGTKLQPNTIRYHFVAGHDND